MKIAVVGLWHLGCVTAACLANASFDVIAYDPNSQVISELQQGKPPLFEPGLEDLLQAGIAAKKIVFTNTAAALFAADIIWVTFDTPVDQHDVADTQFVEQEIVKLFPFIKENAVLIISSQMPVGTTHKLQAQCKDKQLAFAYIPENLRLGKALQVFQQPDRIVVGIDNEAPKNQIKQLLAPFSNNLIFMSIVSAEMTKHAINAFLALSVTFINELASLCETVGANGREVEQGLKTEERIGPKAYLKPGDAIAGGTLLRDINYLMQIGQDHERNTLLISAICASNQDHKQWTCRKLTTLLKNLHGKKIAMLGLTYKAGTDTLRRSTAIETCQWLHQQGAFVAAYDPAIHLLPDEFATYINLKTNLKDLLYRADAVVIATNWPQFRELVPQDFPATTLVVDPSGYIAEKMASDSKIKYYSVGVPS